MLAKMLTYSEASEGYHFWSYKRDGFMNGIRQSLANRPLVVQRGTAAYMLMTTYFYQHMKIKIRYLDLIT